MAENDEWSKPSLKRNSETGEFGYWTGKEMIVLPKQWSSDQQGAQDLIEGLKSTPQMPKFNNINPDEQFAIEKLYQSLQPAPKSNRPRNELIDQMGKQGFPFRDILFPSFERDKKELEAEQKAQEGMSTGDKIKRITGELVGAIPAMVGGGAAATLLPKAASKTGAMLRALGVGGGATGGEYLSQQAGLSPESIPALIASGVGGTLAGGMGGKIQTGPKTAAERKAASIAQAGPIREAEVQAKAGFKSKLNESLSKPDVDSQKIIQPIEDVILKERARYPASPRSGRYTPESANRDPIVNELSDIANNLGNVITLHFQQQPGVPLPKSPTPTVTKGPQLQTSQRTQIPQPGAQASETISPSVTKTQAGIATKEPKPAAAYNTPATQANAPQSPAPARTIVTNVTQQDSAQTIVSEIQRLTRLRERARAIGANDLSHDIDNALKQVRKTIGYDEAAPLWAQGKGFEESKINIRGASKTAREMNRLEGRRAGTFTEAQKQGLIKTAAQSEQIDGLLYWMMNNPTGQALLRSGITPSGTIKPGILHVAAQLAAHDLSNRFEE